MPSSGSSSVANNLEQQHKLAKDLLRAVRDGDAGALARIRRVRPDAGTPSRPLALADAQLAIAREGGFESWPKLVADLQRRDVAEFRGAVEAGDAPRAATLLSLAHVRARVNEPMFAFGQRAAHLAAQNEALLSVLLAAGADVNLESEWQHGPYTVLDHASDDTARFLLAKGARLTPNVAARLGWLAELRAMIDADPALVQARGGDGQQPLHEAKTVEIADFLLDRGAPIDTRCFDHDATPAQYALAERPDVCRRLLERSAAPDIFMPARLGDAGLAAAILDADPGAVAARIDHPGYAPVPPKHIYCWTLGWGLSPHDVARRYGHRDVLDLLLARSPRQVRLLDALMTVDEPAARALLAEEPSLVASLQKEKHALVSQAIFFERFDAAELMLRLGFDPAAPGIDGGTALHTACWLGHVGLVERLIEQGSVPLDARDPTHRSTPLGWAAFGSVHRRAPGGDYPAVAERLVAAGASITAAGNGAGKSLHAMAEGNPAMQEALRRLGAAGS